MHLKEPGFKYSAFEPFTRSKKRIKKNKERGDLRCIYQNKLVKACFRHDMACGDFENLNRRITLNKG